MPATDPHGDPRRGATTYAVRDVGGDIGANSAADLQGSVENLPVPDASYDLVLCTQVLEHSEDPARAVRELRRMRALASTHGVMVYHPAPVDLWHWTHAGLKRLFNENGEWSSLTVAPGSGATACVGMLVAIYVNLLARRADMAPLGRGLVSAINGGAGAVDRRFAALREPRPGTIFTNYHVTAVA